MSEKKLPKGAHRDPNGVIIHTDLPAHLRDPEERGNPLLIRAREEREERARKVIEERDRLIQEQADKDAERRAGR